MYLFRVIYFDTNTNQNYLWICVSFDVFFVWLQQAFLSSVVQLLVPVIQNVLLSGLRVNIYYQYNKENSPT